MDLGFEGEVVVVTGVKKGSAADVANLSVGDVIEMVDGERLTPSSLPSLLHGGGGRRKYQLRVLRDEAVGEPAYFTTLNRSAGEEWGLWVAREGGGEEGWRLRVARIEPDSPAEAANLLAGDEILRVGRRRVRGGDVFALFQRREEAVELKVARTDGSHFHAEWMYTQLTLRREGEGASWGLGLAEEGADGLVNDVGKGSAAERAGVRVGDSIISVGGLEVSGSRLLKMLRAEGNSIDLGVRRAGGGRGAFEEGEAYSTVLWRNPGEGWGMGVVQTAWGGLVISEIRPLSPAAKANLQIGDVILSFNGKVRQG